MKRNNYEKLEKIDKEKEKFINYLKNSSDNIHVEKFGDFIAYYKEKNNKMFKDFYFIKEKEYNLREIYNDVYDTFKSNVVEFLNKDDDFETLSLVLAVRGEDGFKNVMIESNDIEDLKSFDDEDYDEELYKMKKVDRQLRKFLYFVDEVKESNSKMYIKREDDIISYGLEDNSLGSSFRVDSEDTLKIMYNSIMNKYQGEVNDALSIDEDQIPTLYVILNKNLIITINSDKLDDYKWFNNPNYNNDYKINTKKRH